MELILGYSAANGVIRCHSCHEQAHIVKSKYVRSFDGYFVGNVFHLSCACGIFAVRYAYDRRGDDLNSKE